MLPQVECAPSRPGARLSRQVLLGLRLSLSPSRRLYGQLAELDRLALAGIRGGVASPVVGCRAFLPFGLFDFACSKINWQEEGKSRLEGRVMADSLGETFFLFLGEFLSLRETLPRQAQIASWQARISQTAPAFSRCPVAWA